jgi:hypothetical protein
VGLGILAQVACVTTTLDYVLITLYPRKKNQMSDNALSIPGLVPVVAKFATPENFLDIAKATDYLPRLQLYGSGSDAVKEGKIGMAHYGVVTSKDGPIIDVGTEVEIAVLAWRPKALRIGDQVLAYYNPENPAFKQVRLDSEKPNSKCMFGPEYMVWVPKANCFASFHMASKTARREAPKLRALMIPPEGDGNGLAILKARYIKTPQYSWHGPDVSACNTPISPLPDVEKMNVEIGKFANPPEAQIETDVNPSGRET